MSRTLYFFIANAILMALLVTGGCASTRLSQDYLVFVDDDSVILQGYDTVAFFTEGRAVRGVPKYKSVYHGAVYHFASGPNKERFDANPERYKPQFGGHCSMAMAMGMLEPGDATTWSIVDGRLVVQRNEKAKAMWSKNPSGHLMKADGNWPRVVSEHGKRG